MSRMEAEPGKKTLALREIASSTGSIRPPDTSISLCARLPQSQPNKASQRRTSQSLRIQVICSLVGVLGSDRATARQVPDLSRDKAE